MVLDTPEPVQCNGHALGRARIAASSQEKQQKVHWMEMMTSYERIVKEMMMIYKMMIMEMMFASST